MSLVSFSINMAQKRTPAPECHVPAFLLADTDNLFIFGLVMSAGEGSILPSNQFFHQK